MNKLDRNTRALIIRLSVEGSSIRTTGRIADVSKTTVNILLIEAGRSCTTYRDEYVNLDRAGKRRQADRVPHG